MTTTVHMARAFPRGEAGGNPAGVVLDAEGLDAATMQAIAREVGVSETAFVQSTPDGHRVRFFTPRTEVALCGHGTIATYGVLATQGLADGTYTMHTPAGPQSVTVSDGWVQMSQNPPVFAGPLPVDRIARVLGMDPSDILAEPAPQGVSTGLLKIHARVVDRRVLDGIDPDWDAIARFGEATSSTGIFAYTLETAEPGHTARCRNFSSAVGAEDPATGTACGGLASLLVREGLAQPGEELRFEQGDAVGLPSTIRAVISGRRDGITGVQVSGRAVLDAARSIA